MFGVFRVKNHNFTPKNPILGGEGARRVRPSLDPPLHLYVITDEKVWRYQRDNQKPWIEEGHTLQWPKEQVQKGQKVIYKTLHRKRAQWRDNFYISKNEIKW